MLRLWEKYTKFVVGLLSFIYLVILISIAVMSGDSYSYYTVLETLACLITALLLLCLIFRLTAARPLVASYLTGSGQVTPKPSVSYPLVRILIITVILFLIQVFVCYNAYFTTGWDCSIVLSAAYHEANGWAFDMHYEYFSQYPNNLFLVYVFGFIMKIAKLFGITDKSHGFFVLIVFQCLLNSLTGLMIHRILFLLKNRFWARVGYGLYVILIGTCPWLLIPYSDSMGLIFPIFCIFLWLMAGRTSRIWVKVLLWAGIGIWEAIGYHIKPQTVIIFIALVFTEFLYRLCHREGRKLLYTLFIGILLFILSFAFLEKNYTHRIAGIDTDASVGIAHYFMVGLNEETGGTVSDEDWQFSLGIEGKESRNAADLKAAFERVREMGPVRLFLHFLRKTNINYGDGAMGYPNVTAEYFYKELHSEKIPYVSGAIREVLYGTGIVNLIFRMFKHITWLFLLLLIPLGFRYRTDREDLFENCLLLDLFGLFLFETHFEAGARYQYTGLPLLILAATLILSRIANRCRC